MNNNVTRLRLVDTVSEFARAAGELLALGISRNLLKDGVPQGNGQPVLVLPGLGCNDFPTAPLRNFLTEIGYSAYAWEGGINTGPSGSILRHLPERLSDISKHHGGKKVALVGHSMGGIFSRELARAFPEKVSKVITMGSPSGAGSNPDSIFPPVRKLFEILNGKNHSFLTDVNMARQAIVPPPVPTTALYTRHDGIVHWKTCINPRVEQAENVEVHASHCGLVFNPLAWIVIADRLAQHEDKWTPFSPNAYAPILFRKEQAHEGYEPVPHIDAVEPVRIFQL